MKSLKDLNMASKKVLEDSHKLLESLRRHIKREPLNVDEAVSILSKIRKDVYEDLNQIQHEYHIILAVKWLEKHKEFTKAAKLLWNPRQTGHGDEPDLAIYAKNIIQVSAEVTTSKKPDGLIDTRMAKTLTKLSEMEGKKYYFVCSDAMSMRAKTKIRNRNYSIDVVNLQEFIELK